MAGVRGEGRANRQPNPLRAQPQFGGATNRFARPRPSSFSLSFSLFSVRTPTAVVTDLGTEFGVEVGKDGNTNSHVFRGSVRVRLVGEKGRERERCCAR